MGGILDGDPAALAHRAQLHVHEHHLRHTVFVGRNDTKVEEPFVLHVQRRRLKDAAYRQMPICDGVSHTVCCRSDFEKRISPAGIRHVEYRARNNQRISKGSGSGPSPPMSTRITGRSPLSEPIAAAALVRMLVLGSRLVEHCGTSLADGQSLHSLLLPHHCACLHSNSNVVFSTLHRSNAYATSRPFRR